MNESVLNCGCLCDNTFLNLKRILEMERGVTHIEDSNIWRKRNVDVIGGMSMQ